MKLLYKNKQIKKSDDSIVKMLMPSLIGIGVCVTCLLGTTFAWFTDNASTTTQSIESATYGLIIQIDDKTFTVLDKSVEYELYPKEGGYTVYISVLETSTSIDGFCEINGCLYTNQIYKDEIYSFTLDPDVKTVYSFKAVWGSYKENYIKDNLIKNEYTEEEFNNNLGIPKVEEIEQNTSQPEEIETITPSEEKTEVEEDNEITESDSSDTGIDNSDIILDTTEEPSEENEPDTTN